MNNKKTSIVVLNDSLCQSLTKNGNPAIDIMAYHIEEMLKEEKYNDITTIDCGSLTLNKQHNITEFLKNNLSLADIKKTQSSSIDIARRNLFTKLGIPKWQKDFYKINPGDENIHISDTIKNSENSGVVLSCVANDLMTQVWINPISYFLSSLPLMDKSVVRRTKLLMNDEKLRNNVIDGAKKNIEDVLGINENAKICTMGIYKPNVLPNSFVNLFDEINYKLQKITKEYNQSYVNISDIKSKPLDFHPTNEKFVEMSNRVGKELINRFNENNTNIDQEIKTFDFNNDGLDGAIKDIEKHKIIESYYVDNFIESLLKKGYKRDTVLKIMNGFMNGRLNECNEHQAIYKKAKIK